MKKSRTFLTLLLSVCMVLAMMPSMAFAAATDKTDDIVIVHTNDVHCSVDGYAKVAAYKAEMQAANNYVALVDAGDFLQGGNVGSLSKGEYIVQIMNQVGYDVVTPGNHEFDFGMDKFMAAKDALTADVVSANFTDLRTNKPVLDQYVIKTYGDKKVAFVGMNTPETITKSTPAFFKDDNNKYIYGFQDGNNGNDLYKSIQGAVDAAKAAGADYVVGLAHLGTETSASPWTSEEVVANTNGIDVVIDGHSHSVVDGQKVKNKDGKEIPVTQTGTAIANIGEVRIAADGTITTKLVKDYAGEDAPTAALVKEINDKISALTDKVVGKADYTLNDYNGDKRLVRNQENTVGNFVADAYKAVTGADIGLIQGGGVRAPINKGDVTYGHLNAINPWGNELAMVKATGQQIINALEMGAKDCPAESGGFLNVSGLTYDIDTNVATPVVTNEKGEFVEVKDGAERRVKNVMVAGKPIDLAKSYTVASTNYILGQDGDGFTMFHGAENLLKGSLIDVEALNQYLEQNLKGVIGDQYKQTEGRITVIYKTYTEDEYNEAIANAEKEAVKATKAAIARTTRIISAKVVSKKISVKVGKNSKADGFYFRIYNAKGKKVSGLSKNDVNYKNSKKLAKGTYTVKVSPYTYVAGEKVYGKIVTKKVTVK